MSLPTAFFALFLLVLGQTALAQQSSLCPRPVAGATVKSPEELTSSSGVLKASFSFLDAIDPNGFLRYCYINSDGVESPTLVLNPGDQLLLNLADNVAIAPPPGTQAGHSMASSAGSSGSACAGGTMTYATTNLHFHGLNIPPVCHQDETIYTLIQPLSSFEYAIQIPKNDPPGLYWYHPHPHGFSETQVLGGAAGALIINGIEQVSPQTGGLAQQVLIIRDQLLPGSAPSSTKSATIASKQLSLNYVPIVSGSPLPVVMTKPSEKQFWRVANASADTFVDLQIQIGGAPEMVELIAMDGVPLTNSARVSDILLPPAGRAEFIMQGPGFGVQALFVSLPVATGYGGDIDPLRAIASIVADLNATTTSRVPATPLSPSPPRFASLASVKPTATRTLYFSEKYPATQSKTQFFITVDGQTPQVFTQDEPPAIVTQIGAVEEWTIQNRSLEDHAFHIHQLHFLYRELNGVAVPNPPVLDTVSVPHWDGKSAQYPSVTLRLDFRDPEIAGTFVYHCHILEHEDGGMMAKIQVNPAN